MSSRKPLAVWIALVAAIVAVAVWLNDSGIALSAEPPVHHGWAGVLVPGAMGSAQLERGGPIPGYFQPIQIIAPKGVAVSMAVDGQFSEPLPAPVEAGMLIGAVYRLKVTRIPLHVGMEVFPTIEVVDRTYPPRGQELRFPIPVELTQQDLELASRGSFVTRVVYIENPNGAIPHQSDAMHPSWFDAPPRDDPFTVASSMGRPVVILRIGGRTPTDSESPDAQFIYNSPPLIFLADADHPLVGCPPSPLPTPTGAPSSAPAPSPALLPGKPTALDKSPDAGSRVIRACDIQDFPESSRRQSPASDGPVAPEPPSAGQPAAGAAEAVIRGQEPQACPGPAGLPEEAYRGYPGDGYTQPGYVPQFMRPDGMAGPAECPPCPCATFGPWSPSGISCPWPADEYLCDGGDRGALIRVRPNWQIDGMQPQDAVVHYDTIDGRTIVKTTNRVCIYAPRFGVVRKVDLAREGNEFEELYKVNQPIRPGQAGENQLASTSAQDQGAIDEAGVKPPIALVEKQQGIDLSNQQALAAVYDRIKPYEDFSYIRSGILASEDKPVLATRVQAALAWTGKQALQVEMEGKRASAVTGDVRAEAEFVVDVPNHPRLQVCKIASTNSALPGETVDFTIRFDNIGDQKIGNVTIADSLTGRLEYVPGSEQSSMKASFSTKTNEVGSLVLKWDIVDPVPANGGGAVHFQCRVR